MAVEDYFIDLYYVDKTRQPDGTGGFEYAYVIGQSFRGSATRSSSSEQTVASLRGDLSEQYTIITHDNNVLSKDDIIMFTNADNVRRFLRINSIPTHTPEQSAQNEWKYATATLFEPDLRVVN